MKLQISFHVEALCFIFERFHHNNILHKIMTKLGLNQITNKICKAAANKKRFLVI